MTEQGLEKHSSTSPSMRDVPASVSAAGSAAVHHYLSMVNEGQSPRFAEMCAVQTPPGVRGTDRAVMQDRYNMQWLDKMSPHIAKQIVGRAKSAGINISGKYYQSGLADARGPADPAAWIDSAADIKRVAQQRNLHVTGIVEHVAHEVPPPQSKPLSERLMKKFLTRYRKEHPGKKEGELREMIVSKHSPRHKRK